MRCRFVLGVAVALALSTGGCGGDDREDTPGAGAADETRAAPEPEPVEVALAELRDSGMTGTATLTPQGSEGEIATFTAELGVSPPAAGARPTHIHQETCADYARRVGPDPRPVELEGTVVNSLTDVRDGTSVTTVPGSLADRTTGGFSIVVHAPNPPYAPVACGDIPKS
jgi:hypothetical protein